MVANFKKSTMTIFINTVTLLIDTVIITKITATIFQTLVLAGIADSRLHFNPGVCCSVYGIQGGTNVAVNRSHQTSANADQPKLEIHSLQRTAEKCAPTRLIRPYVGDPQLPRFETSSQANCVLNADNHSLCSNHLTR